MLAAATPCLGEIGERHVSTGPWGTLEYYEIPVEAPVTQMWPGIYDERSFWNFGDRAREEVLELLRELGFSNKSIELLATEGEWTRGDGGLEVEFDDRFVESLTADDRAALASWMARHHDEFLNHSIINFEGRAFDLVRERLDPRIVKHVEAVGFRRGRVLTIMDRPYLLRQLGDDRTAKTRLLRTLFTTHGLMVRLVLDGGTDLESITDYWTAGGFNPHAAAILEGAAAEGVARVDLLHILPPLTRKYLFNYTQPIDVFPKNAPDCFWACMQFFVSNPSSRTLDALPFDHFIEHDFVEVEGEPRFGDMVVLFRLEDESFVHSYIHIAGDIVYSKNGSSFLRPYLLTRRDRMMSVYQSGDGFLTRIYRRKRDS